MEGVEAAQKGKRIDEDSAHQEAAPTFTAQNPFPGHIPTPFRQRHGIEPGKHSNWSQIVYTMR